VAGVFHQMPTVGNLTGVWQRSCDGLRISTATVSCDDLDLVSRMSSFRSRLCISIGLGSHGRKGSARGAQRRVEVRQWFVEKKGRRLAHDRPADGHALALTAGKLSRPAFQVVGEVEDIPF